MTVAFRVGSSAEQIDNKNNHLEIEPILDRDCPRASFCVTDGDPETTHMSPVVELELTRGDPRTARRSGEGGQSPGAALALPACLGHPCSFTGAGRCPTRWQAIANATASIGRPSPWSPSVLSISACRNSGSQQSPHPRPAILKSDCCTAGQSGRVQQPCSIRRWLGWFVPTASPLIRRPLHPLFACGSAQQVWPTP